MYLIDTHCHIDKLIYNGLFKNISELIFFLKKNNIKYLLAISTSISNFFCILSLTSYIKSNIKLSCGIHPLYVNKIKSDDIYYLKKFLLYKNVIAIGECGLDYKNVNENIKKLQIYIFEKHLIYSIKYKKPCIIHSRFSENDLLDIIKYYKKFNNFNAIIHCYSYYNKKILYEFLNLGLYISISGLITFKNMYLLRNIIKYIPLNRLLVETDSPYLCPKINKFKYNDPSKIIFIIKEISYIKKISFYKIIKNNIKNFLRLFNI